MNEYIIDILINNNTIEFNGCVNIKFNEVKTRNLHIKVLENNLIYFFFLMKDGTRVHKVYEIKPQTYGVYMSYEIFWGNNLEEQLFVFIEQFVKECHTNKLKDYYSEYKNYIYDHLI